MKLIIALLSTLVLAGCAGTPEHKSMPNPNSDVVSSRVDITQDLNNSYCEMSGFTRFSESKKYYTFECKNGGKFRLPK